MAKLEVERVGGFAGFGMPGGKLRSRGAVDPAKLSPADHKRVMGLFDAPAAASAPARPDAFRYRLTLTGGTAPRTVEVAEEDLPDAVRDCVSDELA